MRMSSALVVLGLNIGLLEYSTPGLPLISPSANLKCSCPSSSFPSGRKVASVSGTRLRESTPRILVMVSSRNRCRLIFLFHSSPLNDAEVRASVLFEVSWRPSIASCCSSRSFSLPDTGRPTCDALAIYCGSRKMFAEIPLWSSTYSG
ncbi:hypothetical protein B0H66DRAFT_377345 [Apodospora peruviana]|uniref:Secreted protein n=1 Tax=Apodospora peruviana TaxID=516989 RepID=A0AAE0M0I1_9PEZI|nr:hypothetical protein B0H66DRAFT_377345 [Apodospora peruviana]